MFGDLQLTPHFRLSEFYNTSFDHLFSANRADFIRDRIYTVRASLIACHLEHLRHCIGDLPIRINSGFRNHLLNIAVGGSPTSQHKSMLAVDITCPDINLLKSVVKVFDIPGFYHQVIYHDNYIHIGFNNYILKFPSCENDSF